MAWSTNSNKSFFLKLFNENGNTLFSSGQVSVSPPSMQSVFVNNFDGATLVGTSIYSNTSSGQSIILDDSKSLVALSFDMSGSMIESDPLKDRLDAARQLIGDLQAVTPDNKYLISAFGGQNAKFILSGSTAVNDPFSVASPTRSDDFPVSPYKNNVNIFAGFRLVRNSNSFPSSPIDGQIMYQGMATVFVDQSLVSGVSYYYSLFAFDAHYRFSKPVNIFVPYDTANKQVDSFQNFYIQQLKGTGVISDVKTKSIWHMSQKSGNTLYDFIGNNDITLNQRSLWAGSDQPKITQSYIRAHNANLMVSDPSGAYYKNETSLNIVLRIADLSSDNLVFSRINLASPSIKKYHLIVKPNGSIQASILGSTISTPAGIIPVTQWKMVTLTIDNIAHSVSIYVDGALVASSSIPSFAFIPQVFDKMYIAGDTNVGFNGSISQLSIHNEVLSSEYISDLFERIDAQDKDNGDRTILVKGYFLPSKNYIGKKVSFFESQGQSIDLLNIFTISPITAGQFHFKRHKRFNLSQSYKIHSVVYNGQVSSQYSPSSVKIYNPTGISSVSQANLVDFISQMNPPVGVSFIQGNRKIQISWDANASDGPYVNIYHSNSAFPSITTDPLVPISSSSSGQLIFSGPMTDGFFVHENISNDMFHYYSICSYDGSISQSSPVSFCAFPNQLSDQLNIHIKAPSFISYSDSYTDGSVRFQWDINFAQNAVTSFIGDDLIIFGDIVNDFTQSVDNEFLYQYNTGIYPIYDHLSGQDISAGQTQQVFLSGADLYSWSTVDIGQIRGRINQQPLSFFFNISHIDIVSNVSVKLSLVDSTLSVASLPFKFYVYNPSVITIRNDSNSKVFMKDQYGVSRQYDGLIAGARQPVVLAVDHIFYDGVQSPNVTCSAQVYTTDSDIFTSMQAALVPGADVTSSMLISTSDPVVAMADMISSTGISTGSQALVSTVKLSLAYNAEPGNYVIYIKSNNSGITSVKKKLLVVKNPLQISVFLFPPISNGVDVAGQQATVTYTDPLTGIVYSVPDGTATYWNITANNSVQSVQLTSSVISSQVVPSGFVASEVISGVDSFVSIGPILNISSITSSNFTITVSCSFNGFSIAQKSHLTILPYVFDQRKSENKFLIEFQDCKQALFTDGKSYAKMIISSDPNTSTSRFASAFTSFETSPIVLSQGGVVNIISQDNGVQILYNDIVQLLSPQGQPIIQTGPETVFSMGSAQVFISGPTTAVYFRKTGGASQREIGYRNYNPVNPQIQLNGVPVFQTQNVIRATYAYLDGPSVTVATSGGGMQQGVIPTVLAYKQPLDIRVVGFLFGTQFSDQLVFNQTETTSIILDVTSSGFPLSSSIPISCSVSPVIDNSVALNSSSINTTLQIIPEITPEERSYAIIQLKKTNQAYSFVSDIHISANYQSLNKQITYSVSNVSSIISKATQGTSISLTGQWQPLCDMINARSSFSLISPDSTSAYAIGGIGRVGMLNSMQKYSPTFNQWISLSSMTARRMAFQSILADDLNGRSCIFVFGGVSSNFNGEAHILSSCEKYDILTDTWSILPFMPYNSNKVGLTEYGVAYGSAVKIGSKIYVISGVKSISADGTSGLANDSIMQLDIATQTWVRHSIDNSVALYGRINPLVATNGSSIIISGGYTSINGAPKDQCAESISIDSANSFALSLVAVDGKFNALSASSPAVVNDMSGDTSYMVFSAGGDELGRDVYKYDISSMAISKMNKKDNSTNQNCFAVLGTSVISAGGLTSGLTQSDIIIDSYLSKPELLLDGDDVVDYVVQLSDSTGSRITSQCNVQLTAYIQNYSASGGYVITIPVQLQRSLINVQTPIVSTTNGYASFSIGKIAFDQIEKLQKRSQLAYGVSSQRFKIVLAVRASSIVGSLVMMGQTQINLGVSQSQLIDTIGTGVSILSSIAGTERNKKESMYISAITKGMALPYSSLLSKTPVSANEALQLIDKVQSWHPYGPSPLYDSVAILSKALNSQSFDQFKKYAYYFTDSNQSNSFSTRQNATQLSLSVSGKYPLSPIFIEYNTSQPYGIYDFVSQSVTLNTLSDMSNGQTVSVASQTSRIGLRSKLISLVKGSLGFGYATFIYDFKNRVNINSINVLSSVDDGSFAKYSAWVSLDGVSYTAIAQHLTANLVQEIIFNQSRYLKVKVSLYDSMTPAATRAQVYGVDVEFTKFKTDVIFSGIKNTQACPGVTFVTSTYDTQFDSNIQIIVTTSKSRQIQHVEVPSSPAVTRAGFVHVPTRTAFVNGVSMQPLFTTNKITFTALHGAWPSDSSVKVVKSDLSQQINSSQYSLIPQKGMVVFNYPRLQSFVIEIEPSANISIIMKIDNGDSENQISVRDVSCVYSTERAVKVVYGAGSSIANIYQIDDQVVFQMISSDRQISNIIFGPFGTFPLDINNPSLVDDIHTGAASISFVDGYLIWNVNSNSQTIFTFNGQTGTFQTQIGPSYIATYTVTMLDISNKKFSIKLNNVTSSIIPLVISGSAIVSPSSFNALSVSLSEAVGATVLFESSQQDQISYFIERDSDKIVDGGFYVLQDESGNRKRGEIKIISKSSNMSGYPIAKFISGPHSNLQCNLYVKASDSLSNIQSYLLPKNNTPLIPGKWYSNIDNSTTSNQSRCVKVLSIIPSSQTEKIWDYTVGPFDYGTCGESQPEPSNNSSSISTPAVVQFAYNNEGNNNVVAFYIDHGTVPNVGSAFQVNYLGEVVCGVVVASMTADQHGVIPPQDWTPLNSYASCDACTAVNGGECPPNNS